ncbi:unnamed protein product, partial [Symbiodinium sp. KB8]
DYMALIDPTGNPVPIVRQGTIVYLTPNVIPYAVADAAKMAASCLPEVMNGIELELGAVELRGVSDMRDSSIDRVFQIGALIAAAQGMKAKKGYKWDMWESNEPELKLIRHVRMWRHEMLDPRIRLANKSPVPITGQWSRLTGERVTYKTYKDGLLTRSNGEDEWNSVVNEDIVEFPKSSDPRVGVDKLDNIDTGHQNEWADIELPDGSVKKCEDPRGHTGHKWIGYTLFVPLDRLTAGGNAEQQTDDKSAVKPKMVKVPGKPSESERRLHEMTHLPYRDWCDHCVRSKGRQSHAVKKNDRQPVIQIDFSFLSTENDLPKRTILNATDVQTGYSMAVVLPAKGSIEKYAVAVASICV